MRSISRQFLGPAAQCLGILYPDYPCLPIGLSILHFWHKQHILNGCSLHCCNTQLYRWSDVQKNYSAIQLHWDPALSNVHHYTLHYTYCVYRPISIRRLFLIASTNCLPVIGSTTSVSFAPIATVTRGFTNGAVGYNTYSPARRTISPIL